MKKFLLLVAAAGSITIASAQSRQPGYGKNDSKEMVYSSSHSNGNVSNDRGFSASSREKEMQIKKIQQDFDQRIAAVNRDRRLRWSEKSSRIRSLEKQRDQQIKQVEQRYSFQSGRDKNTSSYENHKW
jgi:hypothetical protein